MSTVTDAVFFLNADKVIREMMMTEFDALLDGIVQAPEFKGKKLKAVYLQITDQLKIKSMVFFLIGFDAEGNVNKDWNLPLNQLLQSAARGPDLGLGVTRLVNKKQCTTPWHQQSLWDPEPELFQKLVIQVNQNRLGIVVNEDIFFDDVPLITPTASPAAKAPPTLDVPTVTAAADIPVATLIPTAKPASSHDIPTAVPPVAKAKAKPEAQAETDEGISSAEMEAMKAAFKIKLDKMQAERDAAIEKQREIAASLKEQAKEHVESLVKDFHQDIAQKEQQIASLRAQIEHEQKRYAELKEQQVEQAAEYQHEREDLLEQLEAGQDVESTKIEALKTAFTKELAARVEAETAKVNDQLAIREVELFYRDEQMAIFKDEVQRLKAEKQSLLTDSGKRILKSMEDNGVTFVAFHVGVGHITIAIDDVGRYIDDRTAYLAERCGITEPLFKAWQAHFNEPKCTFVDAAGTCCAKAISRVEWAASFEEHVSDRCDQHKQA
jgi:hypothetical protein